MTAVRIIANPAVTVGPVFSDTFAGMAPASAPAFIGMQVLGPAIGAAVVLALYPGVGAPADDVVVPHRSPT